jgi:hypothetical protein
VVEPVTGLLVLYVLIVLGGIGSAIAVLGRTSRATRSAAASLGRAVQGGAVESRWSVPLGRRGDRYSVNAIVAAAAGRTSDGGDGDSGGNGGGY